jgi:hypothetical protein
LFRPALARLELSSIVTYIKGSHQLRVHSFGNPGLGQGFRISIFEFYIIVLTNSNIILP